MDIRIKNLSTKLEQYFIGIRHKKKFRVCHRDKGLRKVMIHLICLETVIEGFVPIAIECHKLYERRHSFEEAVLIMAIMR